MEEVGGGLEAGGGVVVAGDEEDLEGGEGGPDAGEELVEPALGGGGGADAVKDVAGDEEGVGLPFSQGGGEPVEEGGVFGVAIVAVELLAKVPVGGVEEPEGHGGRGCPWSGCASIRVPGWAGGSWWWPENSFGKLSFSGGVDR